MTKQMKRNALEAIMLVIFMLSVVFIEAGTLPLFGIGISASILAVLNRTKKF